MPKPESIKQLCQAIDNNPEWGEPCKDCPTDCDDISCLQETIEALHKDRDAYSALLQVASGVVDAWRAGLDLDIRIIELCKECGIFPYEQG